MKKSVCLWNKTSKSYELHYISYTNHSVTKVTKKSQRIWRKNRTLNVCQLDVNNLIATAVKLEMR